MYLVASNCLSMTPSPSGSCWPSFISQNVQVWTLDVQLPCRFRNTSRSKVSSRSSNSRLCKDIAAKMREKGLMWKFAGDQRASLSHQYFIFAKSFLFSAAWGRVVRCCRVRWNNKRIKTFPRKQNLANGFNQGLQTSLCVKMNQAVGKMLIFIEKNMQTF